MKKSYFHKAIMLASYFIGAINDKVSLKIKSVELT